MKVFEENCYKPIPPEVSFSTPNVEPHILPDDDTEYNEDVTLIAPLSQQAGYYCSVCESGGAGFQTLEFKRY
ncbi:hypothetical protein Q3G72_003743 [Acer saccharum]|nr:hypothetical protein Q3G72_003743 [Acer saccharum]